MNDFDLDFAACRPWGAAGYDPPDGEHRRAPERSSKAGRHAIERVVATRDDWRDQVRFGRCRARKGKMMARERFFKPRQWTVDRRFATRMLGDYEERSMGPFLGSAGHGPTGPEL